MSKTSRRQPVRLDKRLAGFVQITLGNPLPGRQGVGRSVEALAAEGQRRGIVEGAQHAADVLVRAVLAPALVQRPRRFAFEIDQVGIALDHQHLAQVQVAVDAHAQAADRLFRQALDMRQDRLLVSGP